MREAASPEARFPLRASLLLLALAAGVSGCTSLDSTAVDVAYAEPSLGGDTLTLDGFTFRDLNHDGRLQPYEDWRLPAARRAQDLVARMRLSEKSAAMMHPYASDDSGHYDAAKVEQQIAAGYNTFITGLTLAPGELARANNAVQKMAERSRLGIPVTFSSDPRNIYSKVRGASVDAEGFSQWPNPLGLAALGDTDLARRYGDITRQELKAVGIRVSLSPQIDLASEPRWGRLFGTFGDDPELSALLARAEIEGIQSGDNGLGADSVVAVAKHFAGYGAAREGYDAIMPYASTLDFDAGDDSFDTHLIPFEGAFSADVGSVMVTYGALPAGITAKGITLGTEGGAFNAPLVKELLRGHYDFNGVVMTDWGVTRDCNQICREGLPADMTREEANSLGSRLGVPWGVESLSPEERYARAVSIGVDQFGGSQDADLLAQAVTDGLLSESAIDAAVTRIMRQKFELGLFDNPYVSPQAAEALFASPAFLQQGLETQARSQVLLKNAAVDGGPLLPLQAGRRVYLVGLSAEAARAVGLVPVDRPEMAELAIVNLPMPAGDDHPGFDPYFVEGSLGYADDEPAYSMLKSLAGKLPVIALADLSRPAILTPVAAQSQAVLGNFGASDNAILSVITGVIPPQGRLPMALPADNNAVTEQRSEIPNDLDDPEFPRGFGLGY
ncbi:glycoside hydrolase family 3 protein [Marinobacterium lutimaris]|uniref:beta-glucosidase n=1 Tax=Marinobacterium lutimaris TaxID=568106 RepID=A0A1H6DPM1_9GAMM|nr:glycoside hydrolase family 3 N-terminal domain-containing protein [Marinobacterium lutimaris]SEG87161.1 beta-glucosidase [Marinobacterium lutimaris]